MGNANSHVNERRKSTSGDAAAYRHSANAATASAAASPSASLAHHQHSERNRRFSGGHATTYAPPSAENRNSGGGGTIGPVDITKPSGTGKSPNKLLSTAGSALSRTVRGFRPRAGTSDGTGSRPRARANTVSSGQRPHALRRPGAEDKKKNGSGDTISSSPGSTERTRKDSCPSEESTAAAAAAVAAGSMAAATAALDPCDIANAHKKLPTIFKYTATEGAKEVYVSGTFNNWQKLKMCPSTKDFIAIVDLNEGEHEYKFWVDGQWTNDPNEPTIDNKQPLQQQPSKAGSSPAAVSNGSKSVKNNVIRVQKEDFDAYHALDMDSKAVAAAQQNHKKRLFADTFSQEIPGYVSQSDYRSGPPILPPHLNQVILNKDTQLSCEPTLLPEPKHVMLNHLYALSIKDGVMVLSSTQRFKQKYVTTLLYKPMGVRKTA